MLFITLPPLLLACLPAKARDPLSILTARSVRKAGREWPAVGRRRAQMMHCTVRHSGASACSPMRIRAPCLLSCGAMRSNRRGPPCFVEAQQRTLSNRPCPFSPSCRLTPVLYGRVVTIYEYDAPTITSH